MMYLLVFAIALVSDYVWTACIHSISKEKPLSAAFFSALTVLLGGVATITFVSQPKYLIPAVLGAFAGTYLTVRLKRRRV
jgi:hypothetical protein